MPIPHEVGRGPSAGDYHRRSLRHRLDDDTPKGLVNLGRKDDAHRLTHHSIYVVQWPPAYPFDVPRGCCRLADEIGLRTVADDSKRDLGAQLLPRTEKCCKSLLRAEAAYEEGIPTFACPRSGVWMH